MEKHEKEHKCKGKYIHAHKVSISKYKRTPAFFLNTGVIIFSKQFYPVWKFEQIWREEKRK